MVCVDAGKFSATFVSRVQNLNHSMLNDLRQGDELSPFILRGTLECDKESGESGMQKFMAFGIDLATTATTPEILGCRRNAMGNDSVGAHQIVSVKYYYQ